MHKLIEISALLLAAGQTAVLYYTFLLAYSSKAKVVTIYVNAFGEADIELVLLSAVMLFILAVSIKKTFEVYCDGSRRT